MSCERCGRTYVTGLYADCRRELHQEERLSPAEYMELQEDSEEE